MLITAVEPLKKGLCALYIDGELAMKLDAETVLAYRFDVGREIDDDQLHACVLASANKRCKDKALWLLSFRDHSRGELFDKLKRDFGDEAAESAVERCEQLGLINDRRYAERYAADLFHLKHLSERGIRQKLLQKGIDRDLIDEVLSEMDVDEDEALRALIEHKYARSLSDEKGRRRAVAALQRMGYSYSAIHSALREYIDPEEY